MIEFKVGDIVQIISVGGHSDMKNVLGHIGEITHVLQYGNGELGLYKYHVQYFLPALCACPRNCNFIYWTDNFAKYELKKVELTEEQLNNLKEKHEMLRELQ